MRPPIVLSNAADIMIFEHVEALLRFVEPVDVANGEYMAYDADGRGVRLSSEKKVKRGLCGFVYRRR